MAERCTAEELVRTAGLTAIEQGGPVRRLEIRISGSGAIDVEALREEIAWWARGTIVEGARVEFRFDDPSDDDRSDITLVAVETGIGV